MDKRKVKITKVGVKTSTQIRYGTSYKKNSVLKNESTDITNATGEQLKTICDQINETYDIEAQLTSYENNILKWLSQIGLPTTDSENTWLSHILKIKYPDTKGALQASNCLFEIKCIRAYIEDNQHKKACSNALRLVGAYQYWFVAITEATLSLGTSRIKYITTNTKLTEEQYKKCFEFYECCKANDHRKLTSKERWIKTANYANIHFNVNIKPDTIRKEHSK